MWAFKRKQFVSSFSAVVLGLTPSPPRPWMMDKLHWRLMDGNRAAILQQVLPLGRQVGWLVWVQQIQRWRTETEEPLDTRRQSRGKYYNPSPKERTIPKRKKLLRWERTAAVSVSSSSPVSDHLPRLLCDFIKHTRKALLYSEACLNVFDDMHVSSLQCVSSVLQALPFSPRPVLGFLLCNTCLDESCIQLS